MKRPKPGAPASPACYCSQHRHCLVTPASAQQCGLTWSVHSLRLGHLPAALMAWTVRRERELEPPRCAAAPATAMNAVIMSAMVSAEDPWAPVSPGYPGWWQVCRKLPHLKASRHRLQHHQQRHKCALVHLPNQCKAWGMIVNHTSALAGGSKAAAGSTFMRDGHLHVNGCSQHRRLCPRNLGGQRSRKC